MAPEVPTNPTPPQEGKGERAAAKKTAPKPQNAAPTTPVISPAEAQGKPQETPVTPTGEHAMQNEQPRAEQPQQEPQIEDQDTEYAYSETDTDGTPIGVFRELPPRIGPDGETIPADALVARVPIGETLVDVLAPTENFLDLSPEQWTTWITNNFPDFGLNTSSIPPDLLAAVSEEHRRNLPEFARQVAGLLLFEYASGCSDEWDRLNKKNRVEPVDIVFTPLDYPGEPFSFTEATTTLVINTRVLEALAFYQPDEPVLIHHSDGTIIHATSRNNVAYLSGREEINHADFFKRHGPQQFSLDRQIATSSQYDAQPWELEALRAQRDYVKSHPKEFPSPEDGPSEISVLRSRIREAVQYQRQQRRKLRQRIQGKTKIESTTG